ncbi:MAG: DUF3810 domain-containing protein [Oscillospiraceae bacterium]|nr:DUF3810 domain-containing protein [Oscillospiraceae bacterium]
MRAFLRTFRALHVWLLVNAAALALFFALRGQRAWMTAVSERFSMPLERALGRLWAYVPFSVAELCYIGAAAFLAVFLVRSVVLLARAEYRREVLYRRCLTLANAVLSLYAAFCLLWGVNFYADDFCDKSGLYPAPVAYDDLVAVTRYFAEQTALHADAAERDADGAYAAAREASLAYAAALYEPLYGEFPFLDTGADPRPKPVFFSRVMSAMNVTGLYFPFTGESNLNMDFPAATFPFTVAHELAHRRGVASEQQCNFLGVLASVRSGDPAYRYSGWLTGYIHLSNALYAVSPEDWYEIRLSLPETVQADLRAASDYWARYANKPVARVSGKTYDAMLKSYGDELGMRSYGAVVDLLVGYFKTET